VVEEEFPVMRSPFGRLWPAPLLAALLLIAACGADKSRSQTGSGEVDPPAVAATPAAPPPGAPNTPAAGSAQAPQARVLNADGARIFEDVRVLSSQARPAGSDRDLEAAEFIADKLRKAGYEVSFQEFSVETQARQASVSVRSPASRRINALPMQRSGSGVVRAPLVAAGIGRVSEFPAAARGAIVLIQRGELLFQDKVSNAQAAGAAAVLIFNNEPEVFSGSLSADARVPVLAISQADGQALLADLDRGAVEIEVSVGSTGLNMSRNVIATPPGRQCETITGGHYDSVPQAPGASDNATGTATVIEIASIVASKGEMAANCFILFGAEELGLVGSRYYVQSLDPQARGRIKAMLNFDMVGVGAEGWLFIGDRPLQTRAQNVSSQFGMTGSLGALRGASSDHASFQQAGIPAFMLHRTQDPLLHTPQDVIDRVRPELLQQAAQLGVAMLESINAGG
jgi:aminopeptidase YwaD